MYLCRGQAKLHEMVQTSMGTDTLKLGLFLCQTYFDSLKNLMISSEVAEKGSPRIRTTGLSAIFFLPFYSRSKTYPKMENGSLYFFSFSTVPFFKPGFLNETDLVKPAQKDSQAKK